jgi:hypothetical protein
LNEFEIDNTPKRQFFESPHERKMRTKEQLRKLNDEKNELMMSDFDPHNNPKATE